VTGGWPGVDEWVARGFAEKATSLDLALEDALIQVVVKNDEPAFTAGQLVFVSKGDDEWYEPIRRANVVLLLGGVGGTWETAECAARTNTPVLPLADTGGDAKKYYLHMLKHWHDFQWLGLTEKQFQQLGRPATAAMKAAVDLALKVTKTP
jgi:hypothetical protein